MKISLCSFWVFFVGMLLAESSSKLVIPDIFSDGMVVQRQKPIRVWGEGDPHGAVTVEFSGASKSAVFEGNRWSVEFPPQEAQGQVLSMRIFFQGELIRKINDIVVGEVWLASGQSNMDLRVSQSKEYEECSQRPPDSFLRCFTVSHELLKEGVKGSLGTKWQSANKDTFSNWSGGAYHFAYSLKQSLNMPVAIVHVARGGTITEAWCRKEMLQNIPNFQRLLGFKKIYDPVKEQGFLSGFMFERLMAPIVPYSIRGVIWYQGEGNAWDFKDQKELFPLMVRDWRQLFKERELPFYFVQLPRLKGTPWYHFRNAQREIANVLPHSFMAITIDISMDYEKNRTFEESEVYYQANPEAPKGGSHPIHPITKAPIGNRLALGAKALVYGLKEGGEYTGPMLRSAVVEGEKIRVKFDHSSQELMSSDGKAIRGFYVAGADKKFVKAEVTLEKESLLLSAFGNIRPEVIRYGAEDDLSKDSVLSLNLVNQQKLPASPFVIEINSKSDL